MIAPLKSQTKAEQGNWSKAFRESQGMFGISRMFSHLVGFWDPLTPDDSSHQLSATSLLPKFHQKQLIFEKKKKTNAITIFYNLRIVREAPF